MPEPQYGEPWGIEKLLNSSCLLDCNGVHIVSSEGTFDDDDAARIIACINFCRQFRTVRDRDFHT